MHEGLDSLQLSANDAKFQQNPNDAKSHAKSHAKSSLNPMQNSRKIHGKIHGKFHGKIHDHHDDHGKIYLLMYYVIPQWGIRGIPQGATNP